MKKKRCNSYVSLLNPVSIFELKEEEVKEKLPDPRKPIFHPLKKRKWKHIRIKSVPTRLPSMKNYYDAFKPLTYKDVERMKLNDM